MLIAEDLLLLLTDDDSGRLLASDLRVDVALGGALLVELTLFNRVDVAGPGDRVDEGRVIVRDTRSTGDQLLDHALATVGRNEGKRPQEVAAELGSGTRVRLYDRLAHSAVLRAEEGRILGLFPRRSWPTQDASHEATVRVALVAAMRQGVATDARTGALIALLHALKVVDKAVAPGAVGLSKKELDAVAKQIAEGDWAAAAVRSAIDSATAAIIAASVSAVIAAGSGA